MPELIHQHSAQVQGSDGVIYNVFVYGAPRTDGGIWEGWIEFHPVNNIGPVLKTERETTQPNRTDLSYWATGLEPLYLEGAFARAR